MFWHPGNVPVRRMLLLVRLQFLLCVRDVATDAAVEGVGDQLHPVVQRLVPHVQLLCSKSYSQHPVKKIRVKLDFLENHEITYLASATASTFSSLEKVLVFPTECIFMCFSRYSFLGRVFPQTGQVASTCPLQCNLLCLYKLSIPGKVLSHFSHWYGLRPMCIFIWVVRPVLQPKSFPQTLQGNLSFKWTTFMCWL